MSAYVVGNPTSAPEASKAGDLSHDMVAELLDFVRRVSQGDWSDGFALTDEAGQLVAACDGDCDAGRTA